MIEDVDLIAADRDQNFDTTLLHDLMDEMDGLGPKADVIFLLTTNRPRMLENGAGRPAGARRSGGVLPAAGPRLPPPAVRALLGTASTCRG